MFVSFGIFILACGGTHTMEVWTLWHGNYWLSGAIKAVTAIASVPTAILLVRLVPQALALPSHEAMRFEIAERQRTEHALHEARNELELEFYLAEGQRLAHTGSWVFNPAGFEYCSRELFSHTRA